MEQPRFTPNRERSHASAKVSLKDFENFVKDFVASHPNLLHSFLVFSAIKKTSETLTQNLWDQMMKTFPGDLETQAKMKEQFENLSEKLTLEFKMDFTKEKSNLWKPPEKHLTV